MLAVQTSSLEPQGCLRDSSVGFSALALAFLISFSVSIAFSSDFTSFADSWILVAVSLAACLASLAFFASEAESYIF